MKLKTAAIFSAFEHMDAFEPLQGMDDAVSGGKPMQGVDSLLS